MDKSQLKSVPVSPSEITPEEVYLNRRQFLKSMGILGAGALLAACAPKLKITSDPTALPTASIVPGSVAAPSPTASTPGALADELGSPLTSIETITQFSNYYEFGVGAGTAAELAGDFIPNQGEGKLPWQVEVYGLVNNPKTYGLEEILKLPQQERIYRLRCVEAWSMVVPWQGFPLSLILNEVEPSSKAKYVRFETVLDPEQMPGQNNSSFPWPYQEGLRLDEAMHDLTLLATGLYGRPMPNENGAPLRLVVPWKYGFKSIKSIVKIELVSEQPATLWSSYAPNEYGFYANVNPAVDHPRWSQQNERRLGEKGQRETLLFNGYADQVAGLYQGMDLSVNF